MELIPPSFLLKNRTASFFKMLGSAYLILITFHLTTSSVFKAMGVIFEQPYLNDLTVTEVLVFGVGVAPLLESALIIGILWLVRLFAPRIAALLVMAAIFGAMHIAPGVHGGVALTTVVMGYLFGHFYYKAQDNTLSGFWLITIVHALNNLSALGIHGVL